MNGIPKELLLSVGGALLCAFAVSFLMCPLVKSFAYKIGAIDVPKDNRRMHKKPVPRLGGLAIFLGFAGRVHHRRFRRSGRYVPAARVF